jgi:hypothetical protein
MKITTFTFTTESSAPLDLPRAIKATKRWIRRRTFPIRILDATPYMIVVALEVPHNGIHNRAVNSLGRILQRQLDHHYRCGGSRLVPTLTPAN